MNELLFEYLLVPEWPAPATVRAVSKTRRGGDSLPPYEILDAILHGYVEEDHSVEELIAAGFERTTVERVTRLVIVNEYKRRQAAPGVRITPRAFGRDRRYPITSGFRR